MSKKKSKEIIVLSGKGGTGKTSITASLAALQKKQAVLADCDVDAANLHLLLNPSIKQKTPFVSGKLAKIRQEDCISCGLCLENCRFDAIIQQKLLDKVVFTVDPIECEGCGVCVHFCPAKAIDFDEQECGNWMISSTKYGPMVHAKLHIGAENSGKLVSLVRNEARKLAEENNIPYILVDGPPGIGCPVIASLTGSDFVLIITEPTLSGRHDFERILKLVKHFKLPSALLINKWDLNPEIAAQIEETAHEYGSIILDSIPYDPAFTKAQLSVKPVVEISPILKDKIEIIWEKITEYI
ncbi:MinD superfamily P-loop ATPase, contains an inserted ferredoxin domain [Desulfonauticus submarinus]|uniref:MinD superfamily P-loop ATPase, contains an inserted ferredoxin domain n=1 Tax=Desulfonauticus submarinus TaxID=206665 RepID=A0A1H0AGL2_9BACT|nr:ATP-binding protein [Desulfonauticus submarinus]SDN32524.1 MinD superfamily P-loop ATPase, contains an inserted ferredoxin domain [Desulfonauticus submarinus]